MKKFSNYKGCFSFLDASNVDTDIIVPKQFLQKVNKKGFGKHLFHNWRFKDILGKIENENFFLNKSIFRNSSILVTRKNFGCGSSREHAVWALVDYGFKVIIANSFSDIFFNNSLNNQLLLISLNEEKINKIFSLVDFNKKNLCNIDIENEKIFIKKEIIRFNIEKTQKDIIMYNLDSISTTLLHNNKIKEYESKNFIPIFL